MTLSARLAQVVQILQVKEFTYALAGGLVASLYRKEPRATADIDLALLSDKESDAAGVLRELGLEVNALRAANLAGGPLFAIKEKRTPVYIVCGRGKDRLRHVGVDFILSSVPWATVALDRAQSNRVDFGFGAIPCLTREDFVISKLYSVGNQSSRFMDLDDLRSVFESGSKLDWDYIRDRAHQLGLKLPSVLKPFVPKGALKGIPVA